ncbi:hypothetical protein FDP41_000129 [Naegleria fowleri]|uniref:Uncharacterized protein n=1 Tax=Naegleria fowleri TaxID=5763 RepID=A0A6A5CHX3_NAEFO|nr:uncharacterized protein FDP41_000129 [Naegleria fowleri]KAF0985090.1 hypothetical protein FDP41_000129 [Naegleria fowleri]CAG4716370.1 unnamed protein product [Naegleria fowleri]
MSLGPEDTNLCCRRKGACVVSSSSEQEDYPCESILSEEEDEIWISEVGLPQECIILLPPHSFSIGCVGWYCKKRYVFNPKKIKMYISREKEGPFIHWSSLRAEENVSFHLFEIQSIPSDFCYFKFSVTDTFGGNRVYLNKLLVMKEMPLVLPANTEAKTSAETLKESPRQHTSPTKPIIASPLPTSKIDIGDHESLEILPHTLSPNPIVELSPTKNNEFSSKFDDLMFDTNESHLLNADNYLVNGTMMLNCTNVSLKELSASPLISIPTIKQKPNNRKHPLAASLPSYKSTEKEQTSRDIPVMSPRKTSPVKDSKTTKTSPTLDLPLKDITNVKGGEAKNVTLKPSSKKDLNVGKENLVLEERRMKVKAREHHLAKTKKNLEELSERIGEINKRKTQQPLVAKEQVLEVSKKLEDVQKEVEDLKKRMQLLEENVDTIVKKEIDDFKSKFYEKVGMKFKNSLTKIEQRIARETYKVMDERIRILTHQSECKMFDYVRSQINQLKTSETGKTRISPTGTTSTTSSSLTTNTPLTINDTDTSLNISTSEQVALLKQRMQQLQ